MLLCRVMLPRHPPQMFAGSPSLVQPTKVDYKTDDIKASIGEAPRGDEEQDVLVSQMERF